MAHGEIQGNMCCKTSLSLHSTSVLSLHFSTKFRHRTKLLGMYGRDSRSLRLLCLSIGTVQDHLKTEKQKIISFLSTKLTEGGWYYKPAYANYAPQGMPDFDQRQDQWKSIVDGGNGIANTNAVGDDIQVVPVGGAVNPGDVIVAPGPNCMLNTNPAGDDIAKWAFCGPVAVANCFWWFDSKFDDPNGHPGDGVDNFSLVQNYGVGDDHSKTNVPFLIKDLAVKMNTTTKGTTNITDMKNAIQTWLVNKGLSPIFTVKKYNAPNFSFIEDQIEECQDVILLLGFYNATAKLPDQMQMNINPSHYG